MIDGTYNVDIDSPIGRKQGTAILRAEGDKLIADIDMPVIKKQHFEGQVEGDKFSADGMIKLFLLGEITYSLRGEVVGDEMRATLDSSKGTFELAGKRV